MKPDLNLCGHGGGRRPTFRVAARLFPVDHGGLEQDFELVVRPRTLFSVIPRRLADAAGVEIMPRRLFFGRDGSLGRRKVGTLGLAVAGKRALVTVILGGRKDRPTLGTAALMELGLEADFEAGALVERREARVFAVPAADARAPSPS